MPTTNHSALLGGTEVPYVFERAKRRTIGLIVGPQGLVVRAPRWTPIEEVHAVLHEKARWIVRKLDEVRVRHSTQEADRIVWCDGASLPLLGQFLSVQLGASTATQRSGELLQVALPAGASAQQIGQAIATWMQRQAIEHFTQRLNYFAPLLGVQWHKLALSNARTRWGSAKVDGSIRLNWRLMHLAPDVVDYVVVHELSHLRVMNHSPRFWAVVASVLPNYQHLRRSLTTNPGPRW
jgi:predicted metal-dependent hydrolase